MGRRIRSHLDLLHPDIRKVQQKQAKRKDTMSTQDQDHCSAETPFMHGTLDLGLRGYREFYWKQAEQWPSKCSWKMVVSFAATSIIYDCATLTERTQLLRIPWQFHERSTRIPWQFHNLPISHKAVLWHQQRHHHSTTSQTQVSHHLNKVLPLTSRLPRRQLQTPLFDGQVVFVNFRTDMSLVKTKNGGM